MRKNTLYITFDGLCDPLGQSQILPYLTGLAAQGFHITILSCEKEERLKSEKETVLATIGSLPISWNYILYDKDAGSWSRLLYILRLNRLALKVRKEKTISLTHCRSYLASLIGLGLKKNYGIPFLFDMRGFWADERLDGGIWKKSNALQHFFYRYFKRKEQQFLRHSDAIVSLTNAAVNELGKQYPGVRNKTTVIPCCTNTNLFVKNTHTKQPAGLSFSPKDHVLIYTGSIGTWYYTREMIDCVLEWKKQIPELKLLILTKDTEELKGILSSYTHAQQSMVSYASSSYKDVANYLSLAKAAIFFIKPAYSKIASSPTKMAECWAMDLPIITNPGIGDNDLFFNEQKGGVLVNGFTPEAYAAACRNYLALPTAPGTYRNIALSAFDTRLAIERYSAIYASLCTANAN